MHSRTQSLLTTATLGLALIATPALAEQLSYNANLVASEEVPPADSAAMGTVVATYDTETRMLSWTVEYDGLTGPASAAHFHGPAEPGEDAPPVVPVSGDLASPIKGESALTDAQAEELRSGMWYFNLHTSQYPNGEIRGQMLVTNPD